MAQTTNSRPSSRPQPRRSGGGRGNGPSSNRNGRGGGGGGGGRGRGPQPKGFPWARVGIPVGLVVVVIVVLIIVSVAGGGGSSKPAGSGASPAPSGVVAAVTGVPASVFDTVGLPQGLVSAPTVEKSTPALVDSGKPEIFYAGDEWCPYCAAARWSLAVALSRFGTLSGLKVTQSSSSDVYPDTNTLSFYKSGFTSPTVSFVKVEMQNPDHQTLQNPTAAEAKLMAQYDPQGSVPFIDIGNQYVITSTYNPQVLQGMSWGQIAAALSDTSSSVTKSIVGTANLIDAAICKITNGTPSSVCTSSGVKVATSALTTATSS
jgi:glutaredoxin